MVLCKIKNRVPSLTIDNNFVLKVFYWERKSFASKFRKLNCSRCRCEVFLRFRLSILESMDIFEILSDVKKTNLDPGPNLQPTIWFVALGQKLIIHGPFWWRDVQNCTSQSVSRVLGQNCQLTVHFASLGSRVVVRGPVSIILNRKCDLRSIQVVLGTKWQFTVRFGSLGSKLLVYDPFQQFGVQSRVPNLARFSLVVVASFSGYSKKFSVVVAISVASH